MTRPVCVHCGKPYGQRNTRSETLKWRDGEPEPQYRGNGIVVKRGHTYRTTSRETVRRLTAVTDRNREQVEADLQRIPEESSNVQTIWIWDGESWFGGYDPFCTLRCALDYARQAYVRRHQRRQV